MKITRSDGEKLVIVDFPYLLGGIMLIVALVILGHFLKQVAADGIHKAEWLGHSFGFALTFLGAILLLKRSIFEFDLARRQLVWSRTGMFGRQGGTVPFSQIKSAYVDASSDSNGGTTYRVSLTLLEGVLPLTTTLSGGMARKSEIRNAINQALGIPAETVEAQTDADIRAMVANRQKIAAIALVRTRRGCSLKEAKNIVDAMGRP